MDYYPVMERVALQLAGLQARVILGEPGQTTPEDNLEKFGKNLPGYLPRRIRDRRSELEFSQAIAAAYKAYGKDKSELVCKVRTGEFFFRFWALIGKRSEMKCTR